jgi:hypothetical protein
MNVEQETLGLRRAGFSPALTLLMSAFALLIPPATLTSHLRRLTERSPTTHSIKSESAASVIDLAPLHLPRRETRSVSYYAFFEGWLLLSQLPDCLSLSTSFST